MRKVAMVAGLLICLLSGIAWGTPILSVPNPDYDFGSIGIGYMVKHTFMLQNTGTGTLEIFRVRASCGCTTTDLATTTLSPGDSVALEVLVLADHGTIKNVSIYVYTNAPDASGNANDDQRDFDITLHVTGDLLPMPEYDIAPYELLGEYMQVIVDVREAADYAANHLIGAINIPANAILTGISSVPRDALIVVYDRAGEVAESVVANLRNAGYAFSYYLTGGIAHWIDVEDTRYLVNASPLPTSAVAGTLAVTNTSWSPGTLNSNYYVLIDARSAADYAESHLAGAVNIPTSQLASWAGRIPAGARVVLYDQDGSSNAAIAQAAQQAGLSEASALLGGLDEWYYQYGSQYVLQN